MTAPFRLDDANPSIAYTPGWKFDHNVDKTMNGTRHGAAGDNNLSARLRFRGTGIEVYGTLGPEDGQPSATLYINGQFDSAVQLPEVKEVQFDVLWLSTVAMPLGEYVIVIKNENASLSSMLWIDYILLYDYEGAPTGSSLSFSAPTKASVVDSVTGSHSLTRSPDRPTTDGALTRGSAPQSTGNNTMVTSEPTSLLPSSSMHAGPTANPTADTPDGTGTLIGEILGGVIGGIVIIILLLGLCTCGRNLSRGPRRTGTVEPFFTHANPRSVAVTGSDLRHREAAGRLSDEMIASSPPLSDTPGSLLHTSNMSERASSHLNAAPLLVVNSYGRPPDEPLSPKHLPRISAVRRDVSDKAFGQRQQTESHPPQELENRRFEGHLARGDSSDPPPTQMTDDLVLPTDVGQALSYAPPELRSRVATLFRALFARGVDVQPGMVPEEVDSGLRLFDTADAAPPPRYTEV